MIRIGPLALAVRAAAVLAGTAAALIAYPNPLVIVVAVALAVRPRTWTVAALMCAAALGWLVRTELDPVRPSTVEAVALALALYYLHACAALAAVLPNDAHVAPAVLWPWLRRIGLVTALTSALGGCVWAIGVVAHGTLTGVAGWIGEIAVGAVLALGAAFVLVRLSKRDRVGG
jgi:hypothetical protein